MKRYNYEKVNSDIKSAISILKNNNAMPVHLEYLIGSDDKQKAGLLSEDDRRGAIAKLIDGFKINWKYGLGKQIKSLDDTVAKIDKTVSKIKNGEFKTIDNHSLDNDYLSWSAIVMQNKKCNYNTYLSVLKQIDNIQISWDKFYETMNKHNNDFKEVDDKYEEGDLEENKYFSSLNKIKKDLETDLQKLKITNLFTSDSIDAALNKNRKDFAESIFILKEDIEWSIPILLSANKLLVMSTYDSQDFYIFEEDIELDNRKLSDFEILTDKELDSLRNELLATANKYKTIINKTEIELKGMYNSKVVLDSLLDENSTSNQIMSICNDYLKIVKFGATILEEFYYSLFREYEI